jgi:hypothetical protein
VVDGKQPSGKTKAPYDSAVQKLLDEVGLSLLDAANKSEWHNITRPLAEALAAQARAASGVSAHWQDLGPKLPPNGRLRLLSRKGLHHPHHEQLAPRFTELFHSDTEAVNDQRVSRLDQISGSELARGLKPRDASHRPDPMSTVD